MTMISFLMIGTVKWNKTDDLGDNHININFLLFFTAKTYVLEVRNEL